MSYTRNQNPNVSAMSADEQVGHQKSIKTLATLIEKMFNLPGIKCDLQPDSKGFSILFTPQLEEACYNNIAKKLRIHKIDAGKIQSYDCEDQINLSVYVYTTIEEAFSKLNVIYQARLALQRLQVNANRLQLDILKEQASPKVESSTPSPKA